MSNCSMIRSILDNIMEIELFPSLLISAENERRLQLEDQKFDVQAEHEKDLEYESRVDYASWQTDQPDQQEAE